MPQDPNEIGALWSKVSKTGKTYLTGKVNGVSVVVFKNEKKNSEKQPDYRVLKSQPREQKPAEENPFA